MNADNDDDVAADGSSSTETPATLPVPLRTTAKGRLVISRQSMEVAFAAVCKAFVPRPGQPMSRTREEVTALAQVAIRRFVYGREQGKVEPEIAPDFADPLMANCGRLLLLLFLLLERQTRNALEKKNCHRTP